MQFNTLTLTLQNFIAAFSGGYARLQGAANGLLGILVGIEVVLLGLWTALGGGDNVVGIFKKLLHIGLWVWLVQSYPTLCNAFMQSLVQAGLTAGGGGDVSLLMDPSRLAGYGLDATEPLVQKLADLHMTDLSDLLVFEFAYLAILACFFIMAIHVFLAVLEYYLFAALVGIFLPFGLLPATRFLAEKAVGAIVSASVKLMVLAFLLAIVDPVLQQIHFQGPEITFNELWSVFLTVCALMLLTWKGPSLASALLGGAPHLGAADVLQAASTPIATSMAVGAVAGRVAAGASGAGAAVVATSSAAGGAAPAPLKSAGEGKPAAGAGAGPLAEGSSGAGEGRAGGKGEGGGLTVSPGTGATSGASASLVQSVMGPTPGGAPTMRGNGSSSNPAGGSAQASTGPSRPAGAPPAASGGSLSSAPTAGTSREQNKPSSEARPAGPNASGPAGPTTRRPGA